MCVPSITLCHRHVKPITNSKRPRLCSRKSDVISVLFQLHHQKHKVKASICDARWANHTSELGVSQGDKPETGGITGVLAHARLHSSTCGAAVGRLAGRCDHCCSGVNNQAANSLASAPPTPHPSSVPTEMLAVSSERLQQMLKRFCPISVFFFFCLKSPPSIKDPQTPPPPPPPPQPTRRTSQPPPTAAGWQVGAVRGG